METKAKRNSTLRFLVPLVLLAAALSAPAREATVTILHTTDVHGHVLPAYDYEGHVGVGGMLRCAALIRRIRAEQPDLLLVDCGDLIQGGTESYRTNGRIMMRVLESLKYDAWVLGNHEFDWGLDKLKALHDSTSVTMLGGNIVVPALEPNPLSRVRPFVIRQVNGVRVALVGLTTPGIPTWSRPYLLGNLLFEHSLPALGRIMPRVREADPDVLVLLVHQGYRPYGDDNANEIKSIARQYPEFDVIIGAHTHRVVEDARLNGVLYTQAGYFANWLGRVDLVYDTVQRRVISRHARIYDVRQETETDARLEKELAKPLEETRRFLDRAIGFTESPLGTHTAVPGQSPQQELICRAIRKAVRTDFVVHGSLDDRPVPAGVLHESDIWKIVPYENRIGLVYLTPAELREILEENAERPESQSFMGVYGFGYDLCPTAPKGARVSHLRLPNGRPLRSRKRYRVAFNTYALASAGLRFRRLRRIAEQPTSRLKITRHKTRDLLRKYIEKHSPIRLLDDHAVRLVSRTGRVRKTATGRTNQAASK